MDWAKSDKSSFGLRGRQTTKAIALRDEKSRQQRVTTGATVAYSVLQCRRSSNLARELGEDIDGIDRNNWLRASVDFLC